VTPVAPRRDAVRRALGAAIIIGFGAGLLAYRLLRGKL
jgi:hypothetical protein